MANHDPSNSSKRRSLLGRLGLKIDWGLANGRRPTRNTQAKSTQPADKPKAAKQPTQPEEPLQPIPPLVNQGSDMSPVAATPQGSLNDQDAPAESAPNQPATGGGSPGMLDRQAMSPNRGTRLLGTRKGTTDENNPDQAGQSDQNDKPKGQSRSELNKARNLANHLKSLASKFEKLAKVARLVGAAFTSLGWWAIPVVAVLVLILGLVMFLVLGSIASASPSPTGRSMQVLADTTKAEDNALVKKILALAGQTTMADTDIDGTMNDVVTDLKRRQEALSKDSSDYADKNQRIQTAIALAEEIKTNAAKDEADKKASDPDKLRQLAQMIREIIIAPPGDGIFLDVPVFKQPPRSSNCNQYADYMVAKYYAGKYGKTGNIIQPVPYTCPTGVLIINMLKSAGFDREKINVERTKHGLPSNESDWAKIESNLVAGNPVVIETKITRFSPQHWVTITGMSKDKSVIYINNPANGAKYQPIRKTDKRWAGGSNSIIFVKVEN